MGNRSRHVRRLRRRQKLAIVQGETCYLCGGDLPARSKATSLEHVIPRSRGGKSRDTLLAHVKCNMEKGDRRPYPCELLLLRVINDRMDLRWGADGASNSDGASDLYRGA